MKKYKEMVEEITKINEKLQDLSKGGRIQEAENLRKSEEPKFQMYQKLRQLVAHLVQQQKNAVAGNTASNTVPAVTNPASAPSNQGTIAGSSQVPPPIQQQVQNKPQLGDPIQINPPSGIPGNMPLGPGLAAQMQKLMGREGIQGQALLASMAQHFSQNNQQRQNVANQPSSSMQPPPAVQPQPTKDAMDQRRWIGVLFWQDPQTGETKETAVEFMGNTNMCVSGYRYAKPLTNLILDVQNYGRRKSA